jgi:hypothetical protein
MVLHSWGQNLSFHPHVHCIVPGGGLSPSGCSFVRSRKKFFIPVRVLSKMFQGRFLFYLKKLFQKNKLRFSGMSLRYAQESRFQSLIDDLYDISWVVYCKKPFKETYRVIEYLSRYTHKTAIYNNRLVSMDDSSVTIQSVMRSQEPMVRRRRMDVLSLILINCKNNLFYQNIIPFIV